jgi:hypothetical protein
VVPALAPMPTLVWALVLVLALARSLLLVLVLVLVLLVLVPAWSQVAAIPALIP